VLPRSISSIAIHTYPPSWPTAWTFTMFGFDSVRNTSDSRRNRFSTFEPTTRGSSILRATSTADTVSRPRYTVPMAP
jgi:hypothetical protein